MTLLGHGPDRENGQEKALKKKVSVKWFLDRVGGSKVNFEVS